MLYTIALSTATATALSNQMVNTALPSFQEQFETIFSF
uniref:Uncharacterized protein n=1 Tax=Anguilla anguilla TaxID=7936 RepID=A0A0E9PAS7_ANGAN